MKYLCKCTVLFFVMVMLIVSFVSCGPEYVPVVGDNRNSREEKETESSETESALETSDPAQVGDEVSDEPVEHVHASAGGRWEVDLNGHWRECAECLQKFDQGSHVMVNTVCSICNVRSRVSDGTRTILSSYNDKNDILFEKLYDSNGNELYYLHYSYTYSDFGEKLTEKVRKNGIMFYERTYDNYGNIVSEVKYSSLGIPLSE